MKEKTKVKLLALAIMLVTMTLMPIGQVKAALQANPNTQYTKKDSATNWISNFRKMETAGGAMGLNETLNTDLTSSSGSNGIDVHMMRTTEYGAIAILSASGYGNPSNAKAITTTTGNETGIMLNTSYWEITAGGASTFISGVNSRYLDIYTTSYASAKVGDGLGDKTTTNPGTARWHSANYNSWSYSSNVGFIRGKNSIFSFGMGYYVDGNISSTNDSALYSRGVVVCGTGF